MSRKKSSPVSPRERCCAVVACIQPNLSSGGAVGSPRIPDTPSSWRLVLDGFMTLWSFDVFGSGSYASKRVGFRGQPWSYLRLKAYSFFWLCEGAYGAFGGSCRTTAHRA